MEAEEYMVSGPENYAASGEYNLSDKLNSSGEIQQKCLAFDHAALMSNQEG